MVKPHRPSHSTFINRRNLFFLDVLLPTSFFFKPNPTFHVQQQLNMGAGKKEAQRKVREGKVGDGMGNVKVKGENFYR